MLIKPLLIATLETALNHYLALDDNREDLLLPLKGKIIALTIQPFNETLYLCPTGDSIQIIDHATSPADTTISGSIWALGLMGMSAKPMRAVFSGEVKIEGNSQIGKQFQDLFKKIDIDLEGLLAQYTGQAVAGRISDFVRAGKSWTEESIETFKLNATEFLQEETRDLPAKPELDLFFDEVDQLRMAYDRLECRIERLIQQLNTEQK